jgi:hypothetical protein
MTLRELTQSLAADQDVRWANDGYRVHWSQTPKGPMIVATFTSNNFTCALDDSEVKGCYIKELSA